ncbi:hypothetical protein AsFPU1_2955 [Aphanothece sacrum FPU1]|uniref:L,D-TPase catalytic domain-containing protein n=2 Tax=Aphanothece sacrum TaxID=1122 RepID=A0A401IK96_APHSA|nr:hypothetical protein AsFPU1_2955 [Aphanothece sacrum FPU1]GBF87002.1 hypothetical protein AsFPU3_4081 [Aphanothece sacrum FPU3]
MFMRLSLSLFSCLVLLAYISQAKQKQSPVLDQATVSPDIEVTTKDLASQKQQQWQEFQQSKETNPNLQSPKPLKSVPSQKVPLPSPNFNPPIDTPQISNIEPVSLDNYMTLAPTSTTNKLGNPIYKLSLYANGQLLAAYPIVTGQATTQSKNRHQEGSQAPLPDGKYRIASGVVPGNEPEVGEQFLPITPLFSTGRSALGIHYDPSFEKSNGEDGTHGCIGLTNKQDFAQVLSYVNSYQPQYLEVKIQP